MEGLRDVMRRVRAERERRLEQHDLGGVYDEIAGELADIVDEERHAVDAGERAAESSSDERRRDTAKAAADDRRLRLDLLPDDLAGRMRALDAYPFESSEAERRFEALKERLREQLLSQVFDQMSSSMQEMSGDDVARVKDMLAELNEMIRRRDRGDDPRFEEFMSRFGDMFDGNPQNLDELLEQIAARMAAMQAMLNSMSPEQRAQLASLSQQLLDDMDLQWELDQLGASLASAFPDMNWGSEYGFRGDDPLGLGDAMDTMEALGQLDQLEQMLRSTTSPGELAEVDLDRVRDLVGDEAADSLQRLAELTEMLREAGLIDQREGKVELTPRGLRAIGSNAVRDLFTDLDRDLLGQHARQQSGAGHERSEESKPYEPGDPFRLDLHRTVRNALVRRGPGTPVELAPEDFEIERTEHQTRAATVLMLDLSMSMELRDNFLPAKKVAMALHTLISTQFPRDYLGLVTFSETARVITADRLPEVSWDFIYGTNMQHGFMLARKLLASEHGTKQILMITDGEPTAHITDDGDAVFHYPPTRETVEATLAEVVRCTRAGIRINTFMLDATSSLATFIERLTEMNGGRAFFTTPEDLGRYVLVDFVSHRRLRRAG
ncbi:MAG: hypothetical protein H0X22_10110 [Acidimicrobiia bacterium]|nr:hypothetical protein [Acidimicrobiia bacterium]